jgi:hypothetical protein
MDHGGALHNLPSSERDSVLWIMVAVLCVCGRRMVALSRGAILST